MSIHQNCPAAQQQFINYGSPEHPDWIQITTCAHDDNCKRRSIRRADENQQSHGAYTDLTDCISMIEVPAIPPKFSKSCNPKAKHNDPESTAHYRTPTPEEAKHLWNTFPSIQAEFTNPNMFANIRELER